MLFDGLCSSFLFIEVILVSSMVWICVERLACLGVASGVTNDDRRLGYLMVRLLVALWVGWWEECVGYVAGPLS